MKGHLTSEQLVDLAEGVQTDGSGQATSHLSSCSTCRQQLADLQAVTLAVLDVTVPEPSPLFWDHLSARVHDAVETERTRALVGFERWIKFPASGFWVGAAVAPMLAILALAIVTRLDREPAPAAPVASAPGVQAADIVRAEDDASLSLVADLAADLDWEAASDAGFTAHVGVDDDAVADLTDGERRELRELLSGALARPGG